MTFKSMLCNEIQWINNLKNKMPSTDTMGSLWCKTEMKGEKFQEKKSQNPVCFSCQNHILKWLQHFSFMKVGTNSYMYRQWQVWKVMKNDGLVWYLKITKFYKIRSQPHSHLGNELKDVGNSLSLNPMKFT